jgi:ribosomal protein S18 acetylase RimI-like enzyme
VSLSPDITSGSVDRLGDLLAAVDPQLSLRAECDQDREFLCTLYASTRAEELSILPWTADEKKAFLEQQFIAQTTHYRKNYPSAAFLVIGFEGRSVGRLYVCLARSELRLMDIALLPEFRGQGLGRALIHAVIDLAAEAGVDLTLHVEPFNPAMAWYQRLGFEQVEQVGVYWFMRLPEDRIQLAQAKLTS